MRRHGTWTVGVRRVGEEAYEILDGSFGTREEAESTVISFVVWQLEEYGENLESAVYCDGEMVDEHYPPRRVHTWN